MAGMPKFRLHKEAAGFLDKHDLTDYAGDLKVAKDIVLVKPSVLS